MRSKNLLIHGLNYKDHTLILILVTYDEDPKRRNEYVYIAVDIPGLRRTLFKREASNATIVFKPEKW